MSEPRSTPRPSPPAPIWFVDRSSEQVLRLTLRGDLDLTTEAWARTGLETLLATHSSEVVDVDLAHAGFIGVGGVRLLHEAEQHCHDEGRTLRIVDATPTVRRVLLICDFDRLVVPG